MRSLGFRTLRWVFFAVLVHMSLTGVARAQAAFDEDQSALTEGVETIATAGTPGPLSVYGERAFAVVAGRQEGGSLLPVIAAARWEQGRVVAIGHGGMLGDGALGNAGTRRFVLNTVGWLGKVERPRVEVIANPKLAKVLSYAGHRVHQSQALEAKWLMETDVLVIDAHHLRDEDLEPVRRFIVQGGGMLTAGLGWGWLQLHPGKTILEHPGNRLLRDAGFAWIDGTLETTAAAAFKVERLPPAIHAQAAFDALCATPERPAAPMGDEAQACAAVTAAVRVMPEDAPLFLASRQLLERRERDLDVSEAAPLKPRDGVRRALLALQIELEQRSKPEEVRAHPSAGAFPGAVPPDAPRVARTVSIDLSTPGWHSTGLYAPAGAVLTVHTEGPTQGASLRIGCHTDRLWHLKEWKRVPDITRAWALNDGEARVASAFGGLVYIETTGASTGQLTVTVAGVVEAPRFVLGVTTNEDWLKIREAPGPWGELESGKVIVSVPSGHLRTLDDPAPVLRQWDRISDAHATLATIPIQPRRPHRFVADIQISAGYMHSGYPIMTHLDAAEDMVRVERLSRGCWGLLHELGHNHQEDEWTFDGTGEVTCNLFALHAIDTVCSPAAGDRGHPAVNRPPSLDAYLATGAKFDQWQRDPFLALHMYVQLQQAFGWETFERVFAEYRTLSSEQRPRDDGAKRDQWMVRFSRACGKNLGPFFQAWGVPTSEAARSSIDDLPEWMPEELKK